jgi:sec-independent protein translocase protein TatA
MDFLGIGTGELLLILLVALIFMGPDKMIGFARGLGKLMRQVSASGKEFTNKLQQEMDLEAQAKELRQVGKDISGAINETLVGPLSAQVKELQQAGRDVSGAIQEQVALPLAAGAQELRQAGTDVSSILNERVTLEPEIRKEPLLPAAGSDNGQVTKAS